MAIEGKSDLQSAVSNPSRAPTAVFLRDGGLIETRLLNVAAFMLLALSLAAPSGYSLGAVLLLLLGLRYLPALLTGGLPGNAALGAWALTVAAMGCVWAMHIVDAQGQLITNSLGLDRCLKYLLVLILMPAVLALRLDPAALRWGCAIGAVGAGMLALWQVGMQHLLRAEGHTNAIQFGNLALMLGVWSAIWAMQPGPRSVRLAGWAGAAMGLVASLTSGSRGGWAAFPLLMVMLLWLGSTSPVRHWQRLARAVVLTLVASAALAALPSVRQRMELVGQEWSQQKSHDDKTSIGLRRAVWQQAWVLGLAHPWLGAGQTGYEISQLQAVAEKRMPAPALELNHAHNEWLDMFAKRGLMGVAALALFYAVPGFIFWRALRRSAADQGDAPLPRAAALCGLVTVLGYMVFGMTQVMFAHNNGTLMYLLGVTLCLAACGVGARSRAKTSWNSA